MMIRTTGYGFFIVFLITLGSFFGMRWLAEMLQLANNPWIIVAWVCVSTGINYAVAKFLNKEGPVNKVYEQPLERVVLIIGGVFLFLAILMVVGA